METRESKANVRQTSQFPKYKRHQDCDSNVEQLITSQATSALLYLLFYSILMFTLPFAAFFGTRHILTEHTDLSEFTITSLSVSSSVITVYVIIGLYAYKAYNEKEIIIPKKSKEANKKQK